MKARLRYWLWTLAVPPILTVLLLVRIFTFRAFAVPTGAMEHTIIPGDYVLANMTAYGLHMPLSDTVFFATRPQRGDVIVFLFPEDRSRFFLKRVIALPGEQVAIRGKGVYIDGVLLPESYPVFGGGPYTEPEPSRDPLPQKLEDAPEDPGGPTRHYGPHVVPADAVFVLGDNRDNSRDSRFWGFVPLDDVRGKVWRIYFSRDARTRSTRWERIGLPIR